MDRLQPIRLTFAEHAGAAIEPSDDLMARYFARLPKQEVAAGLPLPYLIGLRRENRFLQHRLTQLALTAENLGYSPLGNPARTVCGLMPMGHFRASTERTPDGFVILMDSAIYELIYVACSLVVTSMDLVAPSGEFIGATLSLDRASDLYLGFLQESAEGEPLSLERLPRSNHAQWNFASTVTAGVLDLVIAHEYTHVLLDHFGPERTQDGRANRAFAVHEELAADAIGMLLVKEATAWSTVEGPFLCGVVFAEVSSTLDQMLRGTWRWRSETHPHPVHRMGVMIASNRRESFEGLLPVCDEWYRILRRLKGEPLPALHGRSWLMIAAYASAADEGRILKMLPRGRSRPFGGDPRPHAGDWSRGKDEWDATALLAYIAESFEVGRAVVAYLARRYKQRSDVLALTAAWYLAMAYLGFRSHYGGPDATADAVAFEGVIDEALPNMGEILAIAEPTWGEWAVGDDPLI